MCRILYRVLVSLARLAVRSGHSKDLEIIVLRHSQSYAGRITDQPALAQLLTYDPLSGVIHW